MTTLHCANPHCRTALRTPDYGPVRWVRVRGELVAVCGVRCQWALVEVEAKRMNQEDQEGTDQ